MRAFIYLILIFSIYILMRNLIALGSDGKDERVRHKSRGPELGSEMVEDLYCNTFIPRESAIKEVISGKVYYFCSKECSNRFKQRV